MTLENAIKQLNDFCRAVENEDIRNYIIQKYGDFGVNTEKDYEATKVIISEVKRLKQENEQLIVALKKCSPLDFESFSEDYYCCKFCKQHDDYFHTEDCEYIRLIGGEKE